MCNYLNRQIIFIGTLSLLFFLGCKKEDTTVNNQNETQINIQHQMGETEHLYENYSPSSDDAVEEITDFHNEIEQENVQDKPIDQAIWLLEAYAGNYLMNETEQFTSVVTNSLLLELNETGHTGGGIPIVNGSEILNAYEDALQLKTPEFDVKMIDVTYKGYETGKHVLELIYVGGTNTGLPLNNLDLGNVSMNSVRPVYEPVCVGSGVQQKVYQIINDRINLSKLKLATTLSCNSGLRLVYTETKEWNRHPWSPWNPNGSGDYYGRLYYDIDDDCINAGTPSDQGYNNTINGWLNEAEVIIDHIANEQFPLVTRHFEYSGQKQASPLRYWWNERFWVSKAICVPADLFNN